MKNLKQAIKFINLVRNDKDLKTQIDKLENKTISELIKIANKENYQFNEEELRLAFKHDWQIRWHRYNN